MICVLFCYCCTIVNVLVLLYCSVCAAIVVSFVLCYSCCVIFGMFVLLYHYCCVTRVVVLLCYDCGSRVVLLLVCIRVALLSLYFDCCIISSFVFSVFWS